jgi:hypothetical protein
MALGTDKHAWTGQEQAILDNMPLYPIVAKVKGPCFACGTESGLRDANWLCYFNNGTPPVFHVCDKKECTTLLATKKLLDSVSRSTFLVRLQLYCIFFFFFLTLYKCVRWCVVYIGDATHLDRSSCMDTTLCW